MKFLETGILRIKVKDCKVYEHNKNKWKLLKNKNKIKRFFNALHVIKLFKSHGNLRALIDTKDKRFFKGFLTRKNEIKGARINILPDGRKLDKAYSLFAENLTIHDESSNEHWDVLYKNKNSYSYVYTLKKDENSRKNKYKSVKEFGKCYSKLKRNSLNALKDKNDILALPMYTLLETFMRVGNEMYYKLNKHKGLTTLKKSDVSINKNVVTFKYASKNGVPLIIKKKFPKIYIKRLKEILKEKKKNDFIFVNKKKHTLKDFEFKKAFKNYCGKEFYPHIVRSYYATKKTKEFLKEYKKATKEEIKKLYNSIAKTLGHRRFNKKNKLWEDSYNVTIHHYIEPRLIERVKNMME